MNTAPRKLSPDASTLPDPLAETGPFRMFEALQVGVVVQDARAQVVFANGAALRMLGLRLEELIGRTALHRGEAVREDGTPFPAEDHPGPRALATGRPVRGILMGLSVDDRPERTWLLVNADPEPAQAGASRRVVCTFMDVTPFKQAERRTRDSEARYRQLVEKAQDIIYGTDVNGFFTWVNPVASSLMGYAPHELVGTHFSSLIRPDHRERVAAFLIRQYHERVASTYDEFPVVPRDGREMWIGQNVQLLMGPEQVLGFQAVARDITQRKRAELALERERQQLRGIVTHAPVAMAILDRELRYVAYSHKWAQLWGLDGQSAIGRSHRDVSPRLHPRYQEAMRRVLAGEVVSNPEDAFELGDGTTLYVRWSMHPWRDPDGQVAGSAVAVQNIDLLVRAREAAQQASRLKSEFLANVSHELRTPLGQVIALGILLQDTPLDDQQRQWVEHVQGAAGELLQRIDDILHFTRLESDPVELQRADFDPRDLCGALMEGLSAAAAAKGLVLRAELSPNLPTRLSGDADRLRRLLQQLLANAVKFTERGGVTLRAAATAAAPDERLLLFEVEDTGIGIAPEVQARLFEPFMQADGSPSRRHGGTGIGLALARRLGQALGGELSLSSEPGRGSTFRFRCRFEPGSEQELLVIPAEAGAPAAESEASPARAGDPGPRVLVVEDNPINRKCVIAMLESLGYRAEAAGNGLEAVEACSREAYDAVLMDCMMPEMDGYRATAWIREREQAGRRLPIVALTANTLPGDREKCLQAGMDDYLSKPVSLRVLDRTLRRWIEGTAEPPGSASVAPDAAPATVEVIDLFLQTMPVRLERLGEVARDGDDAALLALAHSVRGAALQLGTHGLAERCGELQEACRRGDPAGAQAALRAVLAEYRAAEAQLQGARDRLVGLSEPSAHA